MRILGGDPDGQLLQARIILGNRSPGLHRVRDQPLIHDPLLDHHFGVAKCRVDVATGDFPVKGDVVRDVGMNQRCSVLGGLLLIDDDAGRLQPCSGD